MSSIGRAACVIALAVGVAASTAFAANDAGASRDISAQRRPSITIYPRRDRPGPTATRHCDAWLAREYRVSGPVVTPQMRCYWR